MSDEHRRAQTAIQAILRLTNLLMAGKRVAVIGHEPELADRLRAMGAQTLVTDPAAAPDGHRVLPENEAVAIADLVVGVTEAHLPFLRDGAILIRRNIQKMPGKTDALKAPVTSGRLFPTPDPGDVTGKADALKVPVTTGRLSTAPDPGDSPGESASPEKPGLFAGMPGVRVRDGVTGYRLETGHQVFVLDLAC